MKNENTILSIRSSLEARLLHYENQSQVSINISAVIIVAYMALIATNQTVDWVYFALVGIQGFTCFYSNLYCHKKINQARERLKAFDKKYGLNTYYDDIDDELLKNEATKGSKIVGTDNMYRITTASIIASIAVMVVWGVWKIKG